MNWTKATIFAVLIVTAIIVAIHYQACRRRGSVPNPGCLIYAVSSWRRELKPGELDPGFVVTGERRLGIRLKSLGAERQPHSRLFVRSTLSKPRHRF